MRVKRFELHIVDKEFETEYDFVAYFETDAEAVQFLEENYRAGNEVSILSIKNVLIENINAWIVKEI